MILRQLSLGQLQTNCYIVGCEETHKGVVIDPGDEAGRILGAVEELSLDVVFVLNTHAHFDHIGANATILKATKAELALHPLDLELLRAGGGAVQFGFDVRPSPEPTLLLDDGATITFGQYALRTLFTPGHTPGHVSFYAKQEAALFDGDVLFAGGIGRTDLPGGDHERLRESIEGRLLPLPDHTVVYSGHGPTTTIGQERSVVADFW